MAGRGSQTAESRESARTMFDNGLTTMHALSSPSADDLQDVGKGVRSKLGLKGGRLVTWEL